MHGNFVKSTAEGPSSFCIYFSFSIPQFSSHLDLLQKIDELVDMKIKMNMGREYDNGRSDMLWILVEELEKERGEMNRVRTSWG